MRFLRRRTPQPAGLLVTRVSRLTNPLLLGVHRAEALDGSQVPPFVARDLLPDVVDALEKGGFVLVVGDSTAGKTRLAYEAMRACLPSHVCVAPDGPDTLRAALTAATANRPSVLWLDDLERYLGVGGVTRADVADFKPVVLATIRTAERDRLSHRHDATRDHVAGGPVRAGRELLDAVTTELHLDRIWSGHELAAAAHTPDPRITRAVVTADRRGIAEQLAGGPELARELREAGDTHARGAALVTAAVDLRRAGYHRPARLEALRVLHESYVRPETSPESWKEALDWATQPLHGASSLLAPVGDGYLAFDYLLEATDPLPDAVWDAIIELASSTELLDVAPAAGAGGKHAYLRAAAAKALVHKEFMIAAELAHHLGEVGFGTEAAEVLGDIAVKAGGAISPGDQLRVRTLRTLWTGSGQGDPDRAFALARDLVQDCTDLLGDTAVETFQARSLLVRNTPDPDEALTAASALVADATTHLGPDHITTLSACFEAAVAARRVEGPRTAVRLYYNLLEHETLAEVSPALCVDVEWKLADSLLAAGEARSAVEVLELVIEHAQVRYGANHGITFEIRLTYVEALAGDGRVDEALDQAEQLAQDAERVLGRDHPTAADARFAMEELVRAGRRV